MKRVMLFVAAMMMAAPALAQHVHEDAQAAPQAGPPAGAPGGGQPPQAPPVDVPWNDAIPAGTADHAARALKESPRHGEWVDIKMADGTLLKSWVVYPERSTKTGVVLVIHDIRGMSDTARAVGDQLAQDGFIAIVPDFLSGKGPNGGGTESLGAKVGETIRSLTPPTSTRGSMPPWSTERSCRLPTARPAWSGSAGAARGVSAMPPRSRA